MPDYTEREFRALTPFQRETQARFRRDWAEWDTSGPDPAKVRFLLRRRARGFEGRALWVLFSLLLTVLAGIGFFLASPVLTELRQNRAELLEERISLLHRDIEGVEAEALNLAGEIVVALAEQDHWYLGRAGTTADLSSVTMAADGSGVIAAIDGSVLFTDDRGATWREVWRADEIWVKFGHPSVGLGANGSGLIVGGPNVLLVTDDRGATWRNVRPREGTPNLRAAAIADDGSGVVAGSDGTVLFTEDRGATWREVGPEGVTADLHTLSMADGHGVILGGHTTILGFSGDTLLITENRGATWREVNLTPPTGSFHSVALTRDGTGAIVGSIGTVLTRLPHLAEPVSSATDMGSLRAAIDALPAGAPVKADSALRVIEGRREVLDAQLAARKAELAETRLGLDPSNDDRRIGLLADALSRCVGSDTTAELVAACAAALADAQDGADSWWRYLIERLPGTILILFLLATLGALYRYNLRMAAFYSARADALDLMETPASRDHAALATFFGAEAVGFRDAKTPADHSTEVARAVAERLSPSPPKAG